MTILIECKTSKADFLMESKKIFRKHPKKGMGTYRFYMCPTDLIKKEQLPENWGLIYVNENGKPRCVYNPITDKGKWIKENRRYEHDRKFDKNMKNEYLMMYTALRRLHLRKCIDLIYDELV